MVRDEDRYQYALALRRKGLSYREILQKVPIAKSTLSGWLHSVGLSRHVTHLLTEKKRLAQIRGGKARHNQRVARVQAIFKECMTDVHNLTKRELLLMGVMLYWAEGSKEKEIRPGSGIRFSNSDARMIRLFLRWLKEAVRVSGDAIHFNLYIHINQREDVQRHQRYWAKETDERLSKFEKIYYKRVRSKTNRLNIGDGYHGVLNVLVRSSSGLLRRVAGWTEAVSNYDWGMV